MRTFNTSVYLHSCTHSELLTWTSCSCVCIVSASAIDISVIFDLQQTDCNTFPGGPAVLEDLAISEDPASVCTPKVSTLTVSILLLVEPLLLRMANFWRFKCVLDEEIAVSYLKIP